MYRILLTTIAACLFSLVDGQTDFEAVKELAKKTKAQDAIIKENITTVSFAYDKNKQTVSVTQSSAYQCLSLEPASIITFGINYDDNSVITKAKSPGNTINKTCGNSRPDWIFHSDDMLCVYSIFFKENWQTKPFIWEKTYNDIRYFSSFYFSSSYATLKETVRFIIPEGLDIEFKEYNTDDYSLKTSKNFDPGEKVTTIEYQIENIPGYKTNEKDIPNHSFVYPHLIIIPKSYKTKDVNLEIFSNLNDYYHWALNMIQKTPKNTMELKPFVDSLISGKTTDLEKLKTIYYWVQDNIRYLAFEDGLQSYVPESADKVFIQKFGDCKGMANLLKTMLNICGFDARLAWIGTDIIRYDFSIPTLVNSNHMVCALSFNNKRYILDATSDYTPFPQNPESLQGRQVLIENGEHYILDTIPLADENQNLILSNIHLSILNNNLKGTISIQFNGEPQKQLLRKLAMTMADEIYKFESTCKIFPFIKISD